MKKGGKRWVRVEARVMSCLDFRDKRRSSITRRGRQSFQQPHAAQVLC